MHSQGFCSGVARTSHPKGPPTTTRGAASRLEARVELSRTRRATRHGRTGGLAEFRPCEPCHASRGSGLEAPGGSRPQQRDFARDRNRLQSPGIGVSRKHTEAACSLMACKRSSVPARSAPSERTRKAAGAAATRSVPRAGRQSRSPGRASRARAPTRRSPRRPCRARRAGRRTRAALRARPFPRSPAASGRRLSLVAEPHEAPPEQPCAVHPRGPRQYRRRPSKCSRKRERRLIE